MNYEYQAVEQLLIEIFELRDTLPDSALVRVNEMHISEKYQSDIGFRVLVHCLKSNILLAKKDYRQALDEALTALSIEISEDEVWLKVLCCNMLGDVYAAYKLLNLSNDMYLNAISQGEMEAACNYSALFYYKIGRNYADFDDFLMAEAYYIRALQSLDNVCDCIFMTNIEGFIIGHLILALTATHNQTDLTNYLEKMEIIAKDNNELKSLFYFDKLSYYTSFNDSKVHDIYAEGCDWFKQMGDDERCLNYAFIYYNHLYEQKYEAASIVKGIKTCFASFDAAEICYFQSYCRLLKIMAQCQLQNSQKKDAITTYRHYAGVQKKRLTILNSSSNEMLDVLKANFLKRDERLLLMRKNEEVNSNAKSLKDAATRLALLNAIGAQIVANCDFNEIAYLITDFLKDFVEIDAVYIAMLNNNKEQLTFLACKEFDTTLALPPIPLDDKSSYLAQCVKTKQIIYIDDTHNKPAERQHANNETSSSKLRALLYCPIMYDEKVVGVYALKSEMAGAYNLINFSLIKELGIFLAIAVANIERSNRLKNELAEQKRLASELQLAREQVEQLNSQAKLTDYAIKEKGATDE